MEPTRSIKKIGYKYIALLYIYIYIDSPISPKQQVAVLYYSCLCNNGVPQCCNKATMVHTNVAESNNGNYQCCKVQQW